MLARVPPKSGYFEAIMDPCWHPLKQLWINFSTWGGFHQGNEIFIIPQRGDEKRDGWKTKENLKKRMKNHKQLRKTWKQTQTIDSGHMLNGDEHRTEAVFIKETRISSEDNYQTATWGAKPAADSHSAELGAMLAGMLCFLKGIALLIDFWLLLFRSAQIC